MKEKSPQLGFRSLSWAGMGLGLISAALLSFEINLTRLFSVSQFYHFAFLVVSIALLGSGASGTFLSLRKAKPLPREQLNLAWLAGGSGLSMFVSYLLVNFLPFDSYSIFVAPEQIVILLLHYAALASPFFFNGMIIGLLLGHNRSSTGRVYAVNLVGSAVGCIVAVSAPAWVDGEGVVALSAGLAAISGVFFLLRYRRSAYPSGVQWWGALALSLIIGLCSLLILGLRTQSEDIPPFFDLKISPYKSLSYALQPPEAELVSSRWNSFSKVDVVASPSLHSVPGLSYRYSAPLPSIRGVFVDGDNLSALLLTDAGLEFAAYMPAAAAFSLQPGVDVLILEPKGGLDILAALELGAEGVHAVESNRLIIQAARDVYQQPGVTVVTQSGRSYLAGVENKFDLIQLPLTDSYHPVGSGAYALGEDYRYTVEAFSDMIAALKPDGLLVVTRWLQETPSEWLRTFTLAVTALEEAGLDPVTQITAMRGYNTGTLLIKKSAFTDNEMANIRKFAEERAFDLVFGPGVTSDEINRYNILPKPVYHQAFTAFVESGSRNEFFRDYPFDVSPPNDQQPFFSHYFKWSQLDEILATLGVTWQPFGGAGFLVVIVIFLLALLLSGMLILLPAALQKKYAFTLKHNQVLLYFGAIGLAFMFVELPLIQRFILYLDQPAYAFAAVLFCILLFSGIGSRYGSEVMSLSHALLILVGILLLYWLALPSLIQHTLGFPLAARLAITVGTLAPVGFLMGIPFPDGLDRARSEQVDATGSGDQQLVAWMWAVNGACSVLASILASLLALSIGFDGTFLLGAVCYFLGWLMMRKFKAGSRQAA